MKRTIGKKFRYQKNIFFNLGITHQKFSCMDVKCNNNHFLNINMVVVNTEGIMELSKEIKQEKFTSEWQKLAINIMFTGSWVNTLAMRRLKTYDLTSQQYNLLRILRGQHPNPVSGQLIQARMIDKMSNISRLIEKLRIKGLLERNISSLDRRVIEVFISSQGIELLKKIDDTEKKWESNFASLSEEEAHTLNYLLDKVRG